MFGRRFIVLLIIGLLFLPIAVPGKPAGAQDVTSFLLSKINELRASKGLNTLAINPLLTQAAQAHSNYLASTPYIHPHRERDGSLPQDRAARVGYTGRVGENVVGGSNASAEWAFNWWLGSPLHYNNMLSDWTEIGIGFADGGQYGRWYTTLFGNLNRAPAASEGHTGVNPAAAASGSTGATGNAVAAGPRPTRRPLPTDTPTITYTPSITYTPRPTFTPTDTSTPAPPTATAILLEISPQPGMGNDLSGGGQPPAGPDTLTPAIVAALSTPAAQQAGSGALEAQVSQPSASNPLRTVLPLAILVQGMVIAGLVIGGIFRRRRR